MRNRDRKRATDPEMVGQEFRQRDNKGGGRKESGNHRPRTQRCRNKGKSVSVFACGYGMVIYEGVS